MPTQYNKLVRDRIPEIIRRSGRQCAVETYPEDEYKTALLEKLVEESVETASYKTQHAASPKETPSLHAASPKETPSLPDPVDLSTEIADLLEVIDAILAAYELDWNRVKAIQKSRREERGAFNQRLRLLWVT